MNENDWKVLKIKRKLNENELKNWKNVEYVNMWMKLNKYKWMNEWTRRNKNE